MLRLINVYLTFFIGLHSRGASLEVANMKYLDSLLVRHRQRFMEISGLA